MSGAPSKAMVSAMTELWDISAPGPDNLFSAPAFVRLREICQTEYPHAGHGGGPTFALGNALHALGLPCGLPSDAADLALPVDEAALQLDNAFRRRRGRRLHLCPLDLADDLPPMAFGPAQIQHFSAAELLDLVDAARLKRIFPGMVFDAKRLSQFHWLVVEERIEFQAPPEARAVPVLFMDLRQDLGRIEPHKGRLPQAVEDALFFLLLAPWEQWSTMPEVDWRGFRVPWVYTVDDDLFVRSSAPPFADTLSWEPHIINISHDETIEIERPVCLRLDDSAIPALAAYDDAAWSAANRRRQSRLFETPIAHFFVRAFLTEDMDEVLAHITTIEAALGLRADYGASGRSRTSSHKRLSATKRVAARVAALLDDSSFANDYQRLFNVRSEFLHGRSMGAISTEERVLARRLSRQVVCALIHTADQGTPMTRELYLEGLLDQGRGMI